MKTRRRNYNADEKEDRLSNLSDCAVLHILSFLNAKQVVQTSVLSTRWRDIWKYLLKLRISSWDFKTLANFTKFVTSIFSLRNASTPVHTLTFQRKGIIGHSLFRRILNYVVSHNIKRLCIKVKCDIQLFPSCIFSCHSLTSLHFYVYPKNPNSRILFPNSLNLPSLTSLYLGYVTLCGGVDHFSTFPILSRLVISDFEILGEQNLCISSTTLTALAIQSNSIPVNYCKIALSTPNLYSFALVGTPFHILSGSTLGSLKYMTIYLDKIWNYVEDPLILLSTLQKLGDIESLTLYSDSLQVLSLIPNVLKIKLNSLRKLKSLKIDMKGISSELSEALIDAKLAQESDMSQEEVAKLREEFKEGSSSIPLEIVRFLLQNSPTARALKR